MGNADNNLEEQCEDAVFQIGCTRERYSVRCANQLEKLLDLIRKKQTANVQTAPVGEYKVPAVTEEQEKLFKKYETTCLKSEKTSKNDVKELSNRIKELKSILKQIEKSTKTEIHQRLE